jgi:hypothetical protein
MLANMIAVVPVLAWNYRERRSMVFRAPSTTMMMLAQRGRGRL